MTDNEVDDHDNYNANNVNDNSDSSDGEFAPLHRASDSDSESEGGVSSRPRSNHVHDGYIDSESEIEETAYQGARHR